MSISRHPPHHTGPATTRSGAPIALPSVGTPVTFGCNASRLPAREFVYAKFFAMAINVYHSPLMHYHLSI